MFRTLSNDDLNVPDEYQNRRYLYVMYDEHCTWKRRNLTYLYTFNHRGTEYSADLKC